MSVWLVRPWSRMRVWQAVNVPGAIEFVHAYSGIPAGTRATLRRFGNRWALVDAPGYAPREVPMRVLDLVTKPSTVIVPPLRWAARGGVA